MNNTISKVFKLCNEVEQEPATETRLTSAHSKFIEVFDADIICEVFDLLNDASAQIHPATKWGRNYIKLLEDIQIKMHKYERRIQFLTDEPVELTQEEIEFGCKLIDELGE